MRMVPVPWKLDDEAIGSGSLSYTFAVDADNLDPLEQDICAGVWSPTPALAWLLSVLRPGDRVLDLGAHIGTFSLPAAALGARVTAVEPSPRNAALLRAASSQNGFMSLDIIERAVDSTPGTLTFLDAGPVSTIETPSIGTASGDLTFTVEATTVDRLGDESFDWAKIDIEGAEDRALAGASRTMRELKGFVIESNGYALKEHGVSPATLVARIRRAGFQVYGAQGRMLFPLGRRFFQPETNVDYVAVAGEPPLPNGWTIGRERSARELSVALAAELCHRVPEHHQYARGAALDAPLGVRLRLAALAALSRLERSSIKSS